MAYPHIFQFDQSPLRDPKSDTDWCIEKYEIKIQSVINLDYLPTIAPDLVGVSANAAEIMAAIKYRLMLHQKKLSVTFNGKEYIPIRQGNNRGYVDARNGPKPQICQIFELTNTTFLLNYHIIAHYWQRNTDPRDENNLVNRNNPANNVLYNRWSETAEMDNCQYTTRTRTGEYAIRSDNVDGQTADELRSNMAVVSVPNGFLRKSSKYTVSEDGLAIQYQVVDEEQFKMPPIPAFEASGYYFERAVKFYANRIGECRVKLKGDKQAPQFELVKAAIIIATTKMEMRSLTLPPPPSLFGSKAGWSIVDDAGLRIDLYKNEVEFYIRCWAACDINRFYGLAAFYDIDTYTPQSDNVPNYTPFYLDRGSAGFLLQAAAYYDPNFRDTSLSTGNIRAPSNSTLTEGDKVQLSRGRQPGQAGSTP